VNDSSIDSAALGEDTVDLQLTPEQILELSQAAETAAVEDKPPSRFHHWHQPLIAKLAAGTIATAALAWWCGTQLAGHPSPAVAATVPGVPRPVLISDAANQAVRIVNPFDATEVFEFPAGTSAADSREQVAQILLQRARQRQSRWERIRPGVGIRTASVYRAP
jgi:hypothetical protein